MFPVFHCVLIVEVRKDAAKFCDELEKFAHTIGAEMFGDGAYIAYVSAADISRFKALTTRHDVSWRESIGVADAALAPTN